MADMPEAGRGGKKFFKKGVFGIRLPTDLIEK
jgi:hypothetical protein